MTHLRIVAEMPPRTPESLLHMREDINARQMRADMADDYRAALRSQLAFGAPLVGLALFAVVLFAADPIGRLAEWRWCVDHAGVAK